MLPGATSCASGAGVRAWDNLQFALRLGPLPQCVVTTTPRPIPLLTLIMNDEATVTDRSRTADNAANLAPAFLAEMYRRYTDTPIGRQELEGEIVEDRMIGLWKRHWLAQARSGRRHLHSSSHQAASN